MTECLFGYFFIIFIQFFTLDLTSLLTKKLTSTNSNNKNYILLKKQSK